MQVQSINYQNRNSSFNGLYKIRANDIGERVSKLVSRYNGKAIPDEYYIQSGRRIHTFWYILSPENAEIEREFEETLLYEHGKFLKINIKETLNRYLCEEFFRVKLFNDGYKEKWKDINAPSINFR